MCDINVWPRGDAGRISITQFIYLSTRVVGRARARRSCVCVCRAQKGDARILYIQYKKTGEKDEELSSGPMTSPMTITPALRSIELNLSLSLSVYNVILNKSDFFF